MGGGYTQIPTEIPNLINKRKRVHYRHETSKNLLQEHMGIVINEFSIILARKERCKNMTEARMYIDSDSFDSYRSILALERKEKSYANNVDASTNCDTQNQIGKSRWKQQFEVVTARRPTEPEFPTVSLFKIFWEIKYSTVDMLIFVDDIIFEIFKSNIIPSSW